MKLLTVEIKNKLPKLYQTEKTPNTEKKIPVKFFLPETAATWYGIEFDGEDIFFGYVNLGDYEMAEFGYFSLVELTTLRSPRLKLEIERDLYWNPETTVSEMLDKQREEYYRTQSPKADFIQNADFETLLQIIRGEI